MKNSLILCSVLFFLSFQVQAVCIVDLGPDLVLCDNSPVVLDAGSGYTSYGWNTSETTQSIVVTTSGTYWVIVDDGTGMTCSDNVQITFDNPLYPELTCIEASCLSCADGSMQVQATGGSAPFTYSWSNGATGSSISGLTPGVYSVWITDVFGCIDSASCTVYVHNFGTGPIELSGNVFFDSDSSGVRDPGESGIFNARVLLTPDNIITYTDSAGNYVFHADTGIHVISLQPYSTWSVSSDSLSYTVDAQSGNYPGNDFGITIPTGTDLICHLTSWIPRCGQIVPFYISVSQLAAMNTNMVIRLIIDSAVIYSSSNLIPSAINGDTLVWNLPTSLGFTSTQFTVFLQLPATLGYQFHTYLETELRDINDSIINVCADSTYKSITCSYDPNDKAVEPEGYGPSHVILIDQTPVLDYMIRFQNTGNDTAFQVIILDTLDQNLDPATFEFIASSHPAIVTLLDHIVEFRFNNILLPDSNIDEPGSHGFVRYRCTPSFSGIPYVLQNTAYIYFDQNVPVQTNTTSNYLDISVGTPSITGKENKLLIYPNPFSEQSIVQFSNEQHKACTLFMYDLTGRMVNSWSTNTSQILISRGSMDAGIYLLRLQSEQDAEILQGKCVLR